jgi:hypothetical protein
MLRKELTGMEHWGVYIALLLYMVASIISETRSARERSADKDRIKKLEDALTERERKDAGIHREIFDWLNRLDKAVKDLPTDQIQAIYDSEKKFQDGLDSILNYFGPPEGGREA